MKPRHTEKNFIVQNFKTYFERVRQLNRNMWKQIERTRMMVLYHYFKPTGALSDPSGPLSAFVSPSAKL